MSRYRKVDTRIWNDEKFCGLTDDGRTIFLFLLTHPNQTALGAMRATTAGMAQELKWLPERFREGLAIPLAEGMVELDEEAHFIALPNFLRYNAADNPNVVKAWSDCLDLLPECELKTRTIQRAYASLKGRSKSFVEAFHKRFGKPANGMPNGMGNRMPNQEQEQEQENHNRHNQGEKTSKVKRRPPETVDADGVVGPGPDDWQGDV